MEEFQLGDNVAAIILGGGRGTRLFPLTVRRSKPAVPVAGRYRLIDLAISNCINSKIRNIFVLTQYNSDSLHKHISQVCWLSFVKSKLLRHIALTILEVVLSRSLLHSRAS